jgi:hypothetical protein
MRALRQRRDGMDRPNDASNEQNPDLDTPGGRDAEPVEDRPNVGTTTPDAYPVRDRQDGAP